MKRREFFQKAGLGSAALASLPTFSSAATPAKAVDSQKPGSDNGEDEGHNHHGGGEVELRGPLANATVSFGQWDLETAMAPGTITPLDRFPNLSDRFRNSHP